MADNTTLNPGTGGDVSASDDIAGVKHQRVKVEWGADGTATDTSTGAAALPVQGAAAAAAAIAGNPVLSGGSDGTNARAMLTDTGGRQVMVGAAAEAAAPVGNPVLVAGAAGANVKTLATDGSGRLIAVGAALSGAAVAGTPVLIAGHDGVNVRTLLTDGNGALTLGQSLGNQYVEALGLLTNPNGATANPPPVIVGGRDGTAVRTLLTDTAGVSYTRPAQAQTWVVATANTAHVAAARTTLFDLFNASGSGVVLRVLGVYIIPALVAVTGVGQTYELIRTSAVGTGGSTLTPQPFDSGNTALPAQVTARTKATGGATTSITWLYVNGSSEETSPYAGMASQLNHVPQNVRAQHLTLHEGQGLKVDQTTSSSVGNVNIVVVFERSAT